VGKTIRSRTTVYNNRFQNEAGWQKKEVWWGSATFVEGINLPSKQPECLEGGRDLPEGELPRALQQENLTIRPEHSKETIRESGVYNNRGFPHPKNETAACHRRGNGWNESSR